MRSVMKARAQDADRKKQPPPQRAKGRRSKQNFASAPGGGCNSLNSQQYSEKSVEVAFNSLPPIHIGGAEPLVEVDGGPFSRSCPLPTSSPFEPSSTSNGSGLLANPFKRKFFSPHWTAEAAEQAIEKGDVFRAIFRVNAHNRQEAYCTIDGVPVDVLINGMDAQNRAIEGDTVAVMLDPVACWTKLKGSTVPINPVGPNLPSGVREVGESCAKIDVTGSRPTGGDCGNESTDVSVHVPLETGSRITYTKPDGHEYIAPESSSAVSSSKQDEASRAIARICAMLNSLPPKRPTGRVLAILKESPRRGAVTGFLAFKGERGMLDNAHHLRQDIQIPISDYVTLLPVDPKFPNMAVSISSLPDFAKEKLINRDPALERLLIAAQMDEWGHDSPLPEARVVKILGKGGEVGTQIASILFENVIYDSKFSPESLECLPSLPWDVPQKEFETRRDFRNICTFTIDPSTAVDLDDALSVEMITEEICRVGVHIADVSYFVLPNTALDTEAQFRSTSVYILQHKLSMLPSELSEGLCSLLPGVDRLAFSITWDFDRSGNIVDRWIGRSVIRSCCKLSYEVVQKVIEEIFVLDQGDLGSASPELHGQFEWKDILNSIITLHGISLFMRHKRFKDGALSLDTAKIGFLFDEGGTPYDTLLRERKDACFLVEEFMLLANRSVAEVISRSFPDSALLRRHPEPNPRKLREFEAFCSKLGFELDTSSSRQIHLSLSNIRKELKDDPALFDILISYASRPMQTAAYFCSGELRGRENDWAHYALSVPFYTHFTSPIRRYPDIIVHRTLSAALDAEEEYLRKRQLLPFVTEVEASGTDACFTGLDFNKAAAESNEGREAQILAAMKFKVPGCEVMSEVAAYCNERKLASRRAEEAGERLYLWTLLKKKQVLFSKARVLGLGPRFVSVYIQEFQIEQRINYDDVEGLAVDWLETTSTLVMDVSSVKMKRPQRRAYNWKKLRPIEDVALVTYPPEEGEDFGTAQETEGKEAKPAMFPLVLRFLSTVPVALHAIGGDDGPLDIAARLYMCSYFG